MLFQLLTQMRPVNSPRHALHLALQEAAAYAGLPAPFLLRLVAERKLACWKTEGPDPPDYPPVVTRFSQLSLHNHLLDSCINNKISSCKVNVIP